MTGTDKEFDQQSQRLRQGADLDPDAGVQSEVDERSFQTDTAEFSGPVINESGRISEPHDEAVPAPEESTVGMGTTMALGCVAGTIVLIIFGLLYLGINALL